MPENTAYSVAAKFNEFINSADLIALSGMMTEDHTFTDSAGKVVVGKEAMTSAWRSFFGAFPGYRNEFEGYRESDDTVAIEGNSICSDARLNGPALWRAKVRSGLIERWQVLKDTPENRANLGL